MSTDERNPNTAAAIAANISTTIRYILKLETTSTRWARIAEIIETAIEAASATDLEKLRRAGNELVRNTPVRVIKPDGSQPETEKASSHLQERANVLIHTVQSMQAADEKGAAKGSKGR